MLIIGKLKNIKWVCEDRQKGVLSKKKKTARITGWACIANAAVEAAGGASAAFRAMTT